MDILSVAKQFVADVVSVEPYGNGHINQTYLVQGDGKKYILQRINTNLFTRPDELMSNVCAVCDHIAKKRGAEHTLNVVRTVDGKSMLEVDGSAYRVFDFIDGVGYDSATPELFEVSARAFGQFASDLSDFDATALYEILPDFHNTEKRIDNLMRAIEEDKCDRGKAVEREIEFVKARTEYGKVITQKLKSGELPLRVTHNDTKLNNVLLNRDSGQPMAVIDLDTVMPGSICYDFGDSIRFGCNTAAEDEPDLDKVDFSLEMYDRYFCGYTTAYPDMTELERAMLPMGAVVMTFECGVRFLTDYINGDTYFKTTRPGQNLDRAHTQFKLVERMEKILLGK